MEQATQTMIRAMRSAHATPTPLDGASARPDRTTGAIGQILRLATSPWTWAAGLAVVCALLFSLPVALPVGSYYWDIVLYQDAAWRIGWGQTPHLDFFAPAGALAYYLVHYLLQAFPGGNLVLLANASIPLLAAPLLALALSPGRSDDATRPAPALILMLMAPFVLFAVLPFNTTQVYAMPGVDAYGLYNRHAALLLYALVAAILFAPRAGPQAIAITGLLLLLFFTKITGFAIGAGLLAYGVLAGRTSLRTGAAVVLSLALIAAVMAFATDLFPAYLENIIALAGMNAGDLGSRLSTAALTRIETTLAIALLCLALAWSERARLLAVFGAASPADFLSRASHALDSRPAWLFMLLAASLLYESQNTGSLEFALVWPALAAIVPAIWSGRVTMRPLLIFLLAIAIAPTAANLANRTLRTASVALTYQALPAPALGPIGRILVRADMFDRARLMNAHYARAAHSYASLAHNDVNASYLLYAEPDFHVSWLIGVYGAMDALNEWERSNGVRLRSILTLDFADPFASALRRPPVRHVAIGNTPGRSIPPLEGKRLAAARQAHAVLQPLCPLTPARAQMAEIFRPVLDGRQRVTLTECWDMHVRTDPDPPRTRGRDGAQPTSLAHRTETD